MPVSIIANSAAQLAQSAIRVRNDALTTGANRLSSGLRVNSAGDDAAAMAVGSSLKITNRALETASLNASSAVSTLQIADGGLNEINNLIIRMQALATQASSGQNDNPTRALIDGEFQNLKTEIDRIAKITEFNGVNLLAGARRFDTTTTGGLSAVGIASVRIDPNLVTADRTFRISYNATTESMTVTRLDAGTSATQTLDITALLDDVAGTGQNLAAGTQLEVGFATLGMSITLNSSFVRANSIAPAFGASTGSDITVASAGFTNATTGVPQEAVAALNALASGYNTSTGALTVPLVSNGAAVRLGALAGVSYSVNGAATTASGVQSNALLGAGPNTVDVYVDLVAPATGTALVGSFTTGAVSTSGTTSGSFTAGVGTGLVGSDYMDNNAATRLTYKIGTGIAAGEDLLNVDIPAFTIEALNIDDIDVLSQMNADDAISRLRNALTTLNQGRATVGAQQLRLEQIGNNLGIVTNNNEAARSALLDADISKEITDYSSNTALLEAGVAMLARANQIPNVLLDLLRNG